MGPASDLGVAVQVPLVPLCCGAQLQPAAFLSKHLPSSVEIVPDYVSQVSRAASPLAKQPSAAWSGPSAVQICQVLCHVAGSAALALHAALSSSPRSAPWLPPKHSLSRLLLSSQLRHR